MTACCQGSCWPCAMREWEAGDGDLVIMESALDEKPDLRPRFPLPERGRGVWVSRVAVLDCVPVG